MEAANSCLGAWKECQGTFKFDPPSNVPGGTIYIKNARWEECDNCGEIIIPHELDKAINKVAASRKED